MVQTPPSASNGLPVSLNPNSRIGLRQRRMLEMTDVIPVLNQLNIVAKDFDATLEFYRRLGVNIPESAKSPQGIRHPSVTLPNGFVLEFDNHALAQTYNAAWRCSGGSSRALIGFSLPTREAVDRQYGELVAAGYEGRQPPYDAFWGARYAILADPDGQDVGLMSPMSENHRSWPPSESPSP